MSWIAAALAATVAVPPAEPTCVQLVYDTPDKATDTAPCVPLKPTPVVCYFAYRSLAVEATWDRHASQPPVFPFEKFSNFRKISKAEWDRRERVASDRALGPKGDLYFARVNDMRALWTKEIGQTAVPRGPYQYESGIDPDGVTAPPFATLISGCDAMFGFTPAFVYRTGASMEKRNAARGCAADILALGERRPALRNPLGGLMAAAINDILRLDPVPPPRAELMAQLRGWSQARASDPDAALIARVRTCSDRFPEGPWSAALADL